MTPKFTVASLFAGIGGICLGFKDAGAEIIWANEIDYQACRTYKENFGDTYLQEGDIGFIDADAIPDFDILTAGFPCQPFSVAGNRLGFNDTRGTLFFDIMRFIQAKRPKAVLLENVKNLVGHDHGRTFEIIARSLKQEGYFFTYKVLNTMEYGNLPQNRERIFVVGFSDEATLQNFGFPDPVPLTKTIDDLIDRTQKADDQYYYTGMSQYYPMLKETMHRLDTIYQLRRVYVRENQSQVCPTLTANMGTGGHNVPLVLDKFGIRKLTERETLRFQGFPDEFHIPDDMAKSHVYKQAGNSVSVPVVRRIAEKMIAALQSNIKSEDLVNV